MIWVISFWILVIPPLVAYVWVKRYGSKRRDAMPAWAGACFALIFSGFIVAVIAIQINSANSTVDEQNKLVADYHLENANPYFEGQYIEFDLDGKRCRAKWGRDPDLYNKRIFEDQMNCHLGELSAPEEAQR